MPLTEASLAGYTALSGQVLRLDDVYALPGGVPYHFNRSFDERTGYRTRSMLMVPMVNHAGEIVGVIQLINRKRHAGARLDSAATRRPRGHPVRRRAASGCCARSPARRRWRWRTSGSWRASSVCSTASSRASVQAIESRDPTTSGHSQRVATLSVGLAEAVSDSRRGWLADVSFSPDRAARATLRRRCCTTSARSACASTCWSRRRSSTTGSSRASRQRFARVRALLVAQHSAGRAGVPADARASRPTWLASSTREAALAEALRRWRTTWPIVRQANEPTVLEEGSFDRLPPRSAGATSTCDGRRAGAARAGTS